MSDDSAERPQRSVSKIVRVRSTMLCSGLIELRARGLFEAYQAKLPPSAAKVILDMTAGVWLPVDVAMEHFRACDQVVESPSIAFDMGAASGRRLHQSILMTLVRLARGAGVSPWTVFASYERLWQRIFDGGKVIITKVGPKDATLDFLSVPFCQFGYFRSAFRGANESGLRLFAETIFVREVSSTATTLRFRVAWA